MQQSHSLSLSIKHIHIYKTIHVYVWVHLQHLYIVYNHRCVYGSVCVLQCVSQENANVKTRLISGIILC